MKEICTDLYYEDVQPGDTLTTATRTVTESDVMQFAGLTGDYFEIHTSATYAAQSLFGERVAHGLLLLSVANGLYTRLGYFYKTGLALLGLDDWRFSTPVKLGDTIRLRMTLAEKRLTSKPGRGIFRWRYELLNQSDQVCAQGDVTRLIACRSSESRPEELP